MGAEEQWANQQEWDEEKRRGFNTEINSTTNIAGQGETCHVHGCNEPAIVRYEICKIGFPGHGWDVELCVEHDSEETAFDVYRENKNGVSE